MKTKTEKILLVLKILSLLGGFGYAIECGSHLLSLIASFINPDWAKRAYIINQNFFGLRQYGTWFFVGAMSLVIILSALKAFVWYRVADLLIRMKLQTPFSLRVTVKLEKIAYLLFCVWFVSLIGETYIEWLSKSTGTVIDKINVEGEFLFISGIVYIISQIFRRGMEMQEENQLTV